jgi:DNA-binding transcriptional LysR family regulator
MELRHLRYFVAVAEELHFRHAAERLHVAQPAVSEQVRKLEAELGVTLLERSQRKVALTAAGKAMLDEARRVLRQADRAATAARNARQEDAGRLRIGYLPDALPSALPRALPHFAATAPGLELVLETGPPVQLLDEVRKGTLDVAMVSLPAPVTGLRVMDLGIDRAVVGLAEVHPLSGEAVVSPGHLEDTPLLLPPRAANPAFYDGVIACWRAAGVTPAPAEAAAPYVEHALLAAAAGAGVAVLSEAATARHLAPGVRFVALDPAPTCEIAAVTDEDPSTQVAALLRLLRRAAGPSNRPGIRAVAAA